MFEFKITGELFGRGRTGILETPHGPIQTPVFMPCGTKATVKSLTSEQLENLGAQIILGNNYHLHLQPGPDTIEKLGGLHQFMNWNKPILTDSGGFQVWSLGQEKAGLAKLSSEGVEFKSHLDGKRHFFSPEVAIDSQIKIGADIIMALDQCTSDQADENATKEALNLTENWLVRSKTEWAKHDPNKQALFGIIQGAFHKKLRRDAAKFVVDQDLPGIAIGGETIGYNMDGTEEVMDWIYDLLPTDKPRYTMGLGLRPSDLIRAINVGADMFDCVAPTRLARNGSLYTGKVVLKNGQPIFESESPTERINISNQRFALDDTPIDPNCDCYTCTHHSRAYLNHLFKSKELLYNTLASIHNVRMMIKTVEDTKKLAINN